MREGQKLVTISYNLTAEIEKRLDEIPLIAVVDDTTLTLARTERAKLNKLIDGFETERKNLNKAINNEFKSALAGAVDRLAKFDENIRDGVETQKEIRTEIIKKEIQEEAAEFVVNLDAAPIDDFLKNYDSRKKNIELWVSKTKSEAYTIGETLGGEAVNDFHTHYNLTLTLSRFAPAATTPAEEIGQTPIGDTPSVTPVFAPTFSTFTITVDNSIKNEIIAYLESKGVLVGWK